MTERKFTSETCINVYDDKDGDHIYVGPGVHGLDPVELRYVDTYGKVLHRITMHPEQAVLVAEAIIRLYGEEK